MSTENDYPIGYGRPPVATQFKPGRSGNPNGRPKSIRTLKTELLDELDEVTRVREGDSERELSKARAIAKSLVNSAVGGNLRATTALLTFVAKGGFSDADEPRGEDVALEDSQIVDAYQRRQARLRSEADLDSSISQPDHKGGPFNEK